MLILLNHPERKQMETTLRIIQYNSSSSRLSHDKFPYFHFLYMHRQVMPLLPIFLKLLKFWHRNICPINEREVIVEEGIWEHTWGLGTKKCLLFPLGLLETARGFEKCSWLGIWVPVVTKNGSHFSSPQLPHSCYLFNKTSSSLHGTDPASKCSTWEFSQVQSMCIVLIIYFNQSNLHRVLTTPLRLR